jgi:N-ethylmaleimide reductase
LEGWKIVLDAVHGKGGVLFLQIFHAGRVTHPLKNKNQELWAPSAIAVRETIRDLNNTVFPVPKEMTLEDIDTVKNEFEESVKLAKEAGFDGIQLHGAHGYLVDAFLRTSSNKRTDQYGGSA